ncbi:hypothetical protein [Chengkuizengella axinellae]|uniref:Uncharacterized protein n=1 Tax=Chengkuizengella axinellae TaxID=3064388 RepID=A0ABT9IU41_9BACL|nr:hypothetical protein [Chengkuizengella sp. 2205SS18-9]MDP5272855.1 hypothetical protein [Chengkuizengella sp. 2205SS18-9]
MNYDNTGMLIKQNDSYVFVGAINPHLDPNDLLLVNVFMKNIEKQEIETIGIYFDQSTPEWKIHLVD